MDSNDVVKAYESDYDELFGKFLSELVTWSNTGKEPDLGDQNIKYSLDLNSFYTSYARMFAQMAMQRTKTAAMNPSLVFA